MERRGLDRREFTREWVVAVLSGVTISVAGCGGGGGSPAAPSGPSPGGPGGSAADPGDGTDTGSEHRASISANHGHEAVLTGTELQGSGDVMLDIRGQADHSHVVALTRDEVDRIAQGERVVTASTSHQGHDHTITFDPTEAPVPDDY